MNDVATLLLQNEENHDKNQDANKKHWLCNEIQPKPS